MTTVLMPTDLEIPQKTFYDNFRFKAYEFAEFPMAVPVNDAGVLQPTPYDKKNKLHPVVIVQSQEELDALKGPEISLVEVSPGVQGGPMRLETEDDVRAALYVQAEQVGAKIDKRWSVEKIEGAIRDVVSKASEVL